MEKKATNETLVSEAEANQEPTLQQNSQLDEEEEEDVEDEVAGDEIGISKSTSLDQKEILRALEVVERDSVAIADSFTSLFASLRLALSEGALDAATKGNRYINSCLRLNEEVKGMDSLATQLKILRKNVDILDSAVNRLLRLP